MTHDATRIVLADPNLKRGGGHYLPYAESVGRAARRLGIDLIIAGNRAADGIASPFKVIPVFEKDYWSEMRAPDGTDPFVHIARQAGVFCADLQRLVKDERITSSDVLFFPYVNLVEASALASLAEQAGDALPRTVLLFRRDLDEQGRDAGVGSRTGRTLLRAALARLCAADKSRRIRFFTDSANLTEDYVEGTQQYFQTAPIPVDEALAPGDGSFRDEAVTVAYLGDARLEKGYQSLPAVAERLEPVLRAGSVRMMVQSNFNVPGGERGISEARERLAAFPGVVLFDEGLSQTEYVRWLGAASLVLLPYNSELYVSRTSGVLAEAICAGVPVIVPRQTWMAEQIAKSGAGVTFDFFDPASFPAAVCDALDRIEALRERAVERSSGFRAFHNPKRLVHFVAGAAAVERAAGRLARGGTS